MNWASKELETRLDTVELGDLIFFNDQLVKLIRAGVPIRFEGAPGSLVDWLQGISHRVSRAVASGQSAQAALESDRAIQPAYLAALSHWLSSRTALSRGSDSATTSDAHDLRVLEPWVQNGLRGDREVDRSKLFAFWLWIVAGTASAALLLSVWSMVPKLRQIYDTSRMDRGLGYRYIEWIYERWGWTASILAATLVLTPILWRFWFHRIAKHRLLPTHLRNLFLVAYLLLGGAMVAAVGFAVFWPVVELMFRLGAPGP